jgi:hypothetical protein
MQNADYYSIFRTSLNNSKIRINPIKYEMSPKISHLNNNNLENMEISLENFIPFCNTTLNSFCQSEINPISGYYISKIQSSPLISTNQIPKFTQIKQTITVFGQQPSPILNKTIKSVGIRSDDYTPIYKKNITFTSLNLPQDMSITKIPIKNKKTKNKVTFEPNYNKIILIYGLSFYNNNNIKNDVWWSSVELNKMREMVTNEVSYLRRIHPQWTISQCIREICKKS